MCWIKLDKKILNWEWFTDGNMLKVWIYLLENAQQFQDGRYRGVELKTGQLITGRRQIMLGTGLTEREVRTCLNRLKSTNEITIETTNQYSLITIVKYDLYQSQDEDNDQQNVPQKVQQKSNKRPTSDQQTSTSKKLRNKDIKNIYKEEIYKEESNECSPEFAKALIDFEDMRKKIKKPLTERAKEMLLKELEKLSIDESVQIQILNQSTLNSWQGVYPLKEVQQQKGTVDILNL